MTPKQARQKRLRQRVAVAAAAYELRNASLISDKRFDRLCMRIKPRVSTDSKRIDKFFREHFEPHTGMWIRKHPDLRAVLALTDRLLAYRRTLKREQI